MTKDEAIDLMNRVPNMQLATVDEHGHPHTRGMFMYSADEHGIVFHTGTFKPLLSQLRGNPHVEASFLDPQSFTQLRVSGTVAEIADLDLKKRS